MQRVHQRVLGCKLGILSNWVLQHAVVKICHFGFVFLPFSFRLYSEALQNVSALFQPAYVLLEPGNGSETIFSTAMPLWH